MPALRITDVVGTGLGPALRVTEVQGIGTIAPPSFTLQITEVLGSGKLAPEPVYYYDGAAWAIGYPYILRSGAWVAVT